MDWGTPVIQPRNDSIPSFTEHDVCDCLSGGISLGKIEVVGQPTITQVVFTAIRESDRACGERYFEAHYPADLPIYYIELSGTFRCFGPPTPGASLGASSSTAFIIFDARTGNVFVTGTPTQAR
ncbi:MAG TPA: hypothetical protein VGP82_01890 [Ktedonobacterales bacterium]|jgi:hypothetical protein|nr:hypothetical protein [Ktedonobacterales bacterium]